jgi:hypothetical protein
MDDIPDMDDEDDELGGLSGGVDEAEDAATASAPAAAGRGSKLLAVRTYDCLITYDKYYQVPRMWLVGYSESGSLLSAQQIFEDISPDYAQKTVTVEPFPHAPLHTASVHPCKHASVMRKVIERMDGKVQEMGRSERKKWKLSGVRRKEEVSEKKDDEEVPEGLRVDQYLLVFLKVSAGSWALLAAGQYPMQPSCSCLAVHGVHSACHRDRRHTGCVMLLRSWPLFSSSFSLSILPPHCPAKPRHARLNPTRHFTSSHARLTPTHTSEPLAVPRGAWAR